MYDLIYNFIQNSLLNTTADTFGLANILSVVSIILIYYAFIKLIVWVFNLFSSIWSR